LKIGEGDYTAERENLFAGETLDTLFAKLKALEKAQSSEIKGADDEQRSNPNS